MKFSREIKIGLLVTGAVAGLLYGMNFLKGVDLFTGVDTYYALYKRVDGLTPSSDILMSGLKVGQVKKIEFTEDKSGLVLVTLQIRKGVYVSKNATASIISSDLLGGRAVEIVLVPGSPEANPGDTLNSDIQTSFSDQMLPVKDRAEKLMSTLDSLASSMNAVLSDKNRKSLDSVFENLDKTLANVESASANIDEMLAPGTGRLRQMIDNVESISDNLRKNEDKLDNIIANFSSISDSLAAANLSSTIRNADAAVSGFSEMVTKINSGEGTLGALMNNDSLYNSLQKSSQDLDELLKDLKKNPNRYLHFSVFGRKNKEAKQ
ncbi:MAG: MlaD family protein [Arcticibacter sp.]